MRREHTGLAVALLASMACEPQEAGNDERLRPGREVDAVVARVGVEVIGASDVADRMQEHGLDRREALDQLIDEAVLVNEARKRGLTESLAQQRAVERVMVRQMLKDFEAELTPERVPEQDVRADFDEHRERFQVPERRESWHILVRDSSEGARKVAETIQREVRTARNPREVYERVARGEIESDFAVIAEELPAISRAAGFERAFKNALFGAKTLGVVEGPIKTKYGWHVVVITDIVPGATRELEDLEEEIRERLSQKSRYQKVEATIDALQAQGLVEFDDEGVDRLLSTTGLPTRGQ